MSSGWIRIHRRLADHPIWTRQRFTQGQAWVDLILMASHTDHMVPMGTKIIAVKRGEILTSQVKLAARWRWDRETVRRFFRAIESLKMVYIRTSKESETGYTIISIVNYDIYQGDSRQPLALVSASDAPSEAPSDPASVPHPCPTIKKGKKGKKEKPPAVSGLSLEEYLARITPEGQEIVLQVVTTLATTRKSGKVSPSIIAAEVAWWSQHPVERVLAGMRTYLAKGYAGQGKREQYLRGIIRNQDGQEWAQGDGRPGPTPGWSAIQRAAEEDLKP